MGQKIRKKTPHLNKIILKVIQLNVGSRLFIMRFKKQKFGV